MNNSKLNYVLQAYSKEELIHLILGLNKRKPGWHGSNESDIEKFLKSYDKNNFEKVTNAQEKLNSWINRMKKNYGEPLNLNLLSKEELEEGAVLEEKYKKMLRRDAK